MQEKLKLPQITLVAMTSVNIKETIQAMEYSMRGIEFGDAVLITHKKPIGLPKNIRYSHTSELTDIDAFNYKMVYELGDHIHTDYAMIVHADGFIVHPEMWRDAIASVDNGGCRSQKLDRRDLKRLPESHRRQFHISHVFLFMHDRCRLPRQIHPGALF